MILSVDNLLTPEELKFIVENLSDAEFIDGKNTAGWHAKLVKNNTQLETKSDLSQELRNIVKTALQRNPLFEATVQPKIIHSILFSRYEQGMFYGSHVDNALMGKQEFWRTDVSFTIFLSPPSSYSGGELVLESTDGDRSFKLEAGSAIVYPSLFLHRVEPVTEGVRLVAVGWVQSLIRDPNQREILFDLDTTRRSIFAKEGKSIEFDLISKSYANLMRMWLE